MKNSRYSFAYLIISLSTILAAFGCRVDQEKEVALYRDVLDQNHLPATRPVDPNEPLTLQQAMAQANRDNEQLGLRGEDYVQALINKNRAVAAFLPTVSFQPAYTILDRPSGSSTGTVTSGSIGTTSGAFVARGETLQRVEAPVVGNINIFRGFGDVANLHAAEATIAQRRELLLDLQATVLLNVAQTYYQVLRSERSVGVLNNSLQLQTARLQDVENRRQNGLATPLAVAQMRAQVAATRVQLVQAQSDVRIGRATLAQLIGFAEVPNPLVDAFAFPPQRAPEPDFEQTALEARQDLLAAMQALRAARYAVDAAISEYYPSVNLDVQGFLYKEFYSDASKWSAILSANLPIFSAGLIEADVRTAWSRLRQAALSESATRRQVLNDIQVSYENLAASEDRIRNLQDEVQASQESYERSRDSYRNGLATNLDVLTAQNELLNAQLQLVSAGFDRTVFYLDLIRATGRLVETLGTSTTQPTSQVLSLQSANAPGKPGG